MNGWSSSGCLEGDVLSEAFELLDEPSDLPLRIAALVVVAAEVVVDLAGGEHLPVGDEDREFAGAEGGPGGEVAGGGEAAHVGADLSDHDLRGAGGDAGDRARESDAGGERAELFLDRVREQIDLLVEEVEVGEDRADHERVVSLETPFERLPQRGQLRAQLAAREFGEDLGIGGAREERVEHRSAGDAED